MLHRVAHPRRQAQARGRVEVMAADIFVERQAADELQGEERPAVLRHPGLVDLGDAGVVQAA
jgi:hypothetical protein